QPVRTLLGQSLGGFASFYLCALILILGFFIAQRVNNSPFSMLLKGIKSNQTRMNYNTYNNRHYTIKALIISDINDGDASAMLGGAGTLVGPVIGAWLIKYFENIFSAINDSILARFWDFLPDGLDHAAVVVSGKFVGEGWFLTLGLVFVLIVVFLPGGVMEGVRRITALVSPKSKPPARPESTSPQPQPAE